MNQNPPMVLVGIRMVEPLKKKKKKNLCGFSKG